MKNRFQIMGGIVGAGFLLFALLSHAQESAPPGIPGPAKEGEEPEGATIGEVMRRDSIIENTRPQRVPIFQDDPDSAWWEVNPHHAFALAQRQQRPLLLLFTADWNAKSELLSEEVFTTRSFNDFARDKVVICYLNYPRNRTDAPMALRRWKEQFKVMGYPNLLVFDPEGNVVQDLTGYTRGRPVTYFNNLKNVVLPLIAEIDARKDELRKRGYRDWSNQEGVPLFARFVQHGGGLVTLEGANLETWTIETGKLSQQDQALVRSFPELGEIATSEGLGE